jgi:hypothetical protein
VCYAAEVLDSSTDRRCSECLLKYPERKNDVMSEVPNGKNIADFIDPDADGKPEVLEREWECLEAEGYYKSEGQGLYPLRPD